MQTTDNRSTPWCHRYRRLPRWYVTLGNEIWRISIAPANVSPTLSKDRTWTSIRWRLWFLQVLMLKTSKNETPRNRHSESWLVLLKTDYVEVFSTLLTLFLLMWLIDNFSSVLLSFRHFCFTKVQPQTGLLPVLDAIRPKNNLQICSHLNNL